MSAHVERDECEPVIVPGAGDEASSGVLWRRAAERCVGASELRSGASLLVVLTLTAVSDLICAVGSIPAIFAVTNDPFIVLTSNIFANLGPRSTYLLLARVIERFHYPKQGLVFAPQFMGVKMRVVELFKIPIGASLGVVAARIGGSIAPSLLRPKSAE